MTKGNFNVTKRQRATSASKTAELKQMFREAAAEKERAHSEKLAAQAQQQHQPGKYRQRRPDDYFPSDQWAPNVYMAFKVLLSVRLSAALWSPISDCDEVYNYWEPLHFLLYGDGFQTWEYSPAYAIRSYAYVGLHYLPAKLLHQLLPMMATKTATFFFIRCLLAFVCATADAYFYNGVQRKYGNGVARLALCFQALGAGYFISAASFLPSSFAMITTTFAYGCWFVGQDFAAVFFVAFGAFLGWPFAAILGAPIAFDMLYSLTEKRPNSALASSSTPRWKLFFLYAFAAGVLVATAMIICDTIFYGKLVFAPLNIVLYNVFTSHGPDLYGVAPVGYYAQNLFLNFNLAAVAACLTLPCTACVFLRYFGRHFYRTHWRQCASVVYVQVAFWLWLIIFARQPHKEERFLYPMYPFICLSAALTLDAYQRLLVTFSKVKKHRRILVDGITWTFVIIFAVLSASRAVGQYKFFHAPFDTYMGLNESVSISAKRSVNVCVGKEWHRFPSSFFLPEKAQLQFINSEFRGLLPKPYEKWTNSLNSLLKSTRATPMYMNDENREEPSRYVDVNSCDFMVDLDKSDASEREPNYSADGRAWRQVKSEPFLLSSRSHWLFRAFYVPALSEKYCVFGGYNVLQRVAGDASDSKKKVDF